MAALTLSEIQGFLTKAFIAEGFQKIEFVDGVRTVDPNSLPPEMERIVFAISDGMAKAMEAQLAKAVVRIPVTASTGSPSAGTLS